MKKLLLITSSLLISLILNAQDRGPAGNVGRSPAGNYSGNGGNQGGPNANGGRGDKPGKNTVSAEALKTSAEIIGINSPYGNGNNPTPQQRESAIRQLDRERANAAAQGRKADANHFNGEINRIKDIDKPVIMRKPINSSSIPDLFSKKPKPYGIY